MEIEVEWGSVSSGSVGLLIRMQFVTPFSARKGSILNELYCILQEKGHSCCFRVSENTLVLDISKIFVLVLSKSTL